MEFFKSLPSFFQVFSYRGHGIQKPGTVSQQFIPSGEQREQHILVHNL